MKREESRGLEVELRSEALQTDMDEDTESWGRGGRGHARLGILGYNQ